MTKFQWSEAQAKRIGEAVKDLRGKRSGKWLEDATGELGHKVSRTTISELETGKRKDVGVAELTVIAAALGVYPAVLLYPLLPDGPVDVLPGITTTSERAYRWFTGDDPRDTHIPQSTNDPLNTVGMSVRLHLTKQRVRLQDDLDKNKNRLRRAMKDGQEEMTAAYRITLTSVVERLEQVEREIEELTAGDADQD